MKLIKNIVAGWVLSMTMLVSLALAAVNLNTASQQELEALPGVGAKQAQQIIQARPFKSVDDLKNVKGIGDKKFTKIAPLVSVDAAQAAAAPNAPAAPMGGGTQSQTTTSTSTTSHGAAPGANSGVTTGTTGGNTAGNMGAMPGSPSANTQGVQQPTTGAMSNGMANAGSNERTTNPHASMAKKSMAAGEMVNINSATQEELQRLPGIGPAKAQAIIQSRPFQKPEDIMKVKGIKQGLFNKIRDHITTG